MSAQDIKEVVKEKYGQAALRVVTGAGSACCGSAPSCCGQVDPITSNLYDANQTGELPDAAVLASLGCGNPTALASLEPGETVLDLGSGGGIDVLLSARRVGRSGKAYGLDMTDEMLALARENQKKAGVENVEFLKGEIEDIPLPANSVDVVISNCVINLSADKGRVLPRSLPRAEAGRAIRGFGRGGARRGARRSAAQRGAVGRLPGGGARRKRIRAAARGSGFRTNRGGADTHLQPGRRARIPDRRRHRRGCRRATGGRQVHERLRARPEAAMKRVLILCTGNSARSQMAEGLLRHKAGGALEVHSAGTRPSTVRPEAIDVLAELGIDISGHRSKHVDEFLGQPFDYLITVCDNAKEACPVFPAQTRRIHWSFEDPAAVSGDQQARLAAFRRIRDQISGKLEVFVESGSLLEDETDSGR